MYIVGESNYDLGGAIIAKTNSTGETVWIKIIESTCNTNGCRGNGIASDAFGNIYISGTFSCDSIMIDSIVLKHNSSSWGYCYFIARLSSDGKAIWAKTPYGQTNALPQITLNDQGFLTVAGSFSSTNMDFDRVVITKAAGGNNASPYIARYNNHGLIQWAKVAVTHYDGTGSPSCIISDYNGNSYLTGNSFGNWGGTEMNFYVETYNNLGDYIFSKEILTGYESSYGIGIDSDSSAYIIGHSNIKGVFGVGYSNEAYTVFVAKLNTGNKILLRPLKPVVKPLYVFCDANSIDTVFAEGANISWFSDPLLHNLVHAGNKFLPVIKNSVTFYATQNIDGIDSWASAVTVLIPGFDTLRLASQNDTLFVQFNRLYSYQWYHADTLLAAFNGNYCIPDTTGIYKVNVSLGHCSKQFTYIVTSKGINDIADDDFKIFPNPVVDILIIQSPTSIIQFNSVKIFDINGQCIFSQSNKTASNEILLNLKHLKSGVYFININFENNCHKHKIIKL